MKKNPNAVKGGKDETILHIIAYIFVSIVALSCLLPFILVISASFSSESAILRDGFSLLPNEPGLEAYRQVFNQPNVILRAYMVTIILTISGTLIALSLQSITAYVLARRDFKWRNGFSLFFYITMLFNGGLVPYFILMTQYLQMRNNYLALLLPLLFSVFNLLILKSYIMGIPLEMIESAKVDGCSVFRTYLSIILPLMKPALATIGLFIALGYWNDWYSAMLFISDDKMKPLQYMLYEKVNNIEGYKRLIASGTTSISAEALSAISIPTESLKMALTVVVTGPIILLYPIIQKYYVKGITLGAVKG
ncbi:MAG: carbohydrate ABC transporter permease [Treponema sp.]|nr:carbohydrate ABC transporter permease [Treponema sp.]